MEIYYQASREVIAVRNAIRCITDTDLIAEFVELDQQAEDAINIGEIMKNDIVYLMAIVLMIVVSIGTMLQNQKIVLRYNDLAGKYNNLSMECPYHSNYYAEEMTKEETKLNLSELFKTT